MINIFALGFATILVAFVNVFIGLVFSSKHDAEEGIFALAIFDAFAIVALGAILLTEKGIMVW